MDVEIICTGDEVLTGKITNSNFAYIAQRMEDCGFNMLREVTVGDEREALLKAFQAAGERADAVIVNGGLGPTVDDLSQEVAAQASNQPLVMNDAWLACMQIFFASRSRTMPENNKKQAMLPANAEVLDNPIGTACGFALSIGRARFFFTPGVPRELKRMLEEQILPRMQTLAGRTDIVHLKRFHSYGLGESHVDELLQGNPELTEPNGVKLGFRAHYPQLEIKLTVRAENEAQIAQRLQPAERIVRKELGNFLIAEDDKTLEGNVLALLHAQGKTLSVLEGLTGGRIASRLMSLIQSHASMKLCGAASSLEHWQLLLDIAAPQQPSPADMQAYLASAVLALSAKTSSSMAMLCWVVAPTDESHFGVKSQVYFAICDEGVVQQRYAELAGGRGWVLSGACEMGLDSLRRVLAGLPIDQKIDFEKR